MLSAHFNIILINVFSNIHFPNIILCIPVDFFQLSVVCSISIGLFSYFYIFLKTINCCFIMFNFISSSIVFSISIVANIILFLALTEYVFLIFFTYFLRFHSNIYLKVCTNLHRKYFPCTFVLLFKI